MPSFDDVFRIYTKSEVFAAFFRRQLTTAADEYSVEPNLRKDDGNFVIESQADFFGGSSRSQEERMTSLLMKTIPIDPGCNIYAEWKLNDYKGGDNAEVEYSYRGSDRTLSMTGYFAYYYVYPEDIGQKDCEGLYFAFTGNLYLFENKDEFIDYVSNLGGIFCLKVTDKTDYLINNDPETSSSEVKAASELGIPIISEIEFIEKFGDPYEFNIEERFVPDGPVKKQFIYKDGAWHNDSQPVKYRFVD